MKHLPPLFHITDHTLKQDFAQGMVIVRDYGHPEREAYARGIIRRCGRKRVMIAGDIALARRLGCAGVHVPEWQLKRLPQRIFAPAGWMITAACHNLKALKAAARHRLVRAVLLSPLFATGSPIAPASAIASAMSLSASRTEGGGLLAAGSKKPLGLVRFGLLARQASVPVIALGGLKSAILPRLCGWGAAGIALRSNGLQ